MALDYPIHYSDKDHWCPLPEWARFLLEVGEKMAALSATSEKKPCCAVVVPIQDYAAALVALGAVSETAKRTHDVSIDAHFNRLYELPKNAHVRVLEGQKYRRGTIIGRENSLGARRIQIAMKWNKGASAKKWFTPKECQRVQPISEGEAETVKSRNLRKLLPNAPFVSGLLGTDDLTSFGMVSSLDCLAVTHPARFRREVSERFLGVRNSKGFHAGSVQDLLRVREYIQGTDAYHTVVVSPMSREQKKPTNGEQPPLVVFDGINGFLRRQKHYPDSGWVIIVDRSAPNVDEAAAALTNEFIRRSDSLEPDWETTAPGIEVACFWR